MRLQEILTPQRVAPSLPASSKKRLLEKLSFLLGAGGSDVDVAAALHSLLERERLGSTGIGQGVALPHGRLKGLKKVVGAFATLEHEMDYNSLDRKPVRMAFALLVPENAADEHLRILSELAGIFRKKETRQNLLSAKNPEELYRTLTVADSG
jgi:PTS system nitrogen regulatory IIA component